jgi:hypothetical protein
MDMKIKALLFIALLIAAGLTGYSQTPNGESDLIAVNHRSTVPSNLMTTPRDGTIHVRNLDAFLEIKRGVEAYVAEPRDYKRNTEIGLSNREVGRMIIIHPNPVVDRFRLKIPAEVGEVSSAGIYNMDGNRVRSFGSKIGDRKDHDIEMDANDLTPGLYFLRIENEAGIISRSFEVH